MKNWLNYRHMIIPIGLTLFVAPFRGLAFVPNFEPSSIATSAEGALKQNNNSHDGSKIRCSNIFSISSDHIEIKDLKSFANAMTHGMLLRPEHADLFEVYRLSFFGDPETSLDGANFSLVTKYLRDFPELRKPHFKEYEISQVEKVYETPDSLAKYLKSQLQTAGEVRSRLFQIEANIGFWKKVLDYQDLETPTAILEMQKKVSKDSSDAEKTAYRNAKANFDLANRANFEAYLNHIISKTNRDLLGKPENNREHYQKKAKTLFATLKYIQEWMDKNGRSTQFIRQAMVDLIHTVGFGNQATQTLLKSENGLDRIEGLRKLLDERDLVAINLGYQGHFAELQEKLGVQYPTGLSKNENPSENILRLEQEVLAGRFTTNSHQTTRVRSLSIQEAPFRSCLGGSDCSSKTYFSKALDPNFNYFTMTDSDLHSSGHVTVVLGSAVNPRTGLREKIAFLDKLQNVPNKRIPAFLQAVSISLADQGYKLGVPENVGDENGISNMESIRQYIASEIVPNLSQRLKGFTPTPHQYKFENAFSRAYKSLSVKVFEPIHIGEEIEIAPGREYQAFEATKDLNRKKLVQELINLKDSADPEDLMKFISSGHIVRQLQQIRLYTVNEFERGLQEIVDRTELPFMVRKHAAFESLLLDTAPDRAIKVDFTKFTLKERAQISSEIDQWKKSNDQKKKDFADNLKSRTDIAINLGHIRTLEALCALNFLDINSKNESGFSLLVQAGFAENSPLVAWLAKNPNLILGQRDSNGFNETEQLRLMGKNEMADLIESHRKDITSRRFNVMERNPDGSAIVDFVRIDPGPFKMGLENPKLDKFINQAFEIMSVPTTQRVWQQVADLARFYFKNDFIHLPPSPSKEKLDQYPVVRVSYKTVIMWINALNKLSSMDDLKVQNLLTKTFPGHKKGDVYRLPSSAEFEFVSRQRGIVNDSYSFGGNIKKLRDYFWYASNSGRNLQPVGQKKPLIINGKPLYDMHGNVHVWTSSAPVDSYSKTYSANANQESLNRIVRGGAFNSEKADLSPGSSSYYRTDFYRLDIGLRIVRDIN